MLTECVIVSILMVIHGTRLHSTRIRRKMASKAKVAAVRTLGKTWRVGRPIRGACWAQEGPHANLFVCDSFYRACSGHSKPECVCALTTAISSEHERNWCINRSFGRLVPSIGLQLFK